MGANENASAEADAFVPTEPAGPVTSKRGLRTPAQSGVMADAQTVRGLVASRSTALAVIAVITVLAVTHALLPLVSPPVAGRTVTVARYGAYLAVFCVWMAWFVVLGARWLREPKGR